ncbi:MAG: glycine cleavage T C-terminal barrel domain-containing protein, partial [Thermodesulfobacteriota bacterium]
ITPVEAGLSRFVGLDKEVFLGDDIIKAQAKNGVEKTLAGFILEGPGVPRDGYDVQIDGVNAGFVTSGTLSPCLRRGLGMAYLPPSATETGTEIEVIIRGRPFKANVVKTPFYKKRAK